MKQMVPRTRLSNGISVFLFSSPLVSSPLLYSVGLLSYYSAASLLSSRRHHRLRLFRLLLPATSSTDTDSSTQTDVLYTYRLTS